MRRGPGASSQEATVGTGPPLFLATNRFDADGQFGADGSPTVSPAALGEIPADVSVYRPFIPDVRSDGSDLQQISQQVFGDPNFADHAFIAARGTQPADALLEVPLGVTIRGQENMAASASPTADDHVRTGELGAATGFERDFDERMSIEDEPGRGPR